jgi:hypothetical protein
MQCCIKITAYIPKNGQERSKKRLRNARGIVQRSISTYSTNTDGGVTDSQRFGDGGLAQAWGLRWLVPPISSSSCGVHCFTSR